MSSREFPTILILASFVGVAWSGPPNRVHAADDLVIADFEGTQYGDWTATGEAFGTGPARGALPGQMSVSGYLGQGLVNSFLRGDATTGTLTSPEFKIERKYLGFLIGGGKDAEKLALQLLIGGDVVRSATGPNEAAGGSEELVADSWDVGEYLGKTAVLCIIDEATGGWGHINVDQIVQTDRKPPGLLIDAQREFPATARYLNIPIKNGAPKRKVTLLVDGTVAVVNDIELAPDKPDWWATMDVGPWKGKTLTLQVDRLPENSAGLSAVQLSDEQRDNGALYREPLRGQFHFSPQRGWNNDPNGLAYFNGEYHLFFQHNPYGWGWGNMHWGHAVSKDLVHWQELGDVLAPDEMGPMFSGSAVVDWKNTSGLGRDGQPPLVLSYTAAGNPTVQCLASSTDGRTFEKFAGNPILKQITGGNRDPKIIWHEPTERWVMVLYVELDGKHTIHFFTSQDLKEWTCESVIDGFFECPDFFELAVDGDASNKKWALTAANSEYMLGSFDGKTFKPETPKLAGHRGRGFYAAQTFSDIPAEDGRRIQIGWFQTETKGMPFNQSMTAPLELNLTQTPDGPRMTFAPARELAVLRATAHEFDRLKLKPGDTNPLGDVQAELIELRAEFAPGDATEVAFNVRGAVIAYDAMAQELRVNDHRAPAPLRDGKQRITVLCDRTGLEIFASDGLTYVPMPFQPNADDRSVKVDVQGAPVTFGELQVYELKSAWDDDAATVEAKRK